MTSSPIKFHDQSWSLNGVYNPSDFGSAYVTVPMMTGIYEWETPVKGLLEPCPSNTIPLGFGATMVMKKGFLGYASNKYKQESKQAGLATLGR